jgi:hypothetical protein
MDLSQRKQEALARKAAAEKSLTDEDRSEQAQRAEIAAIEAEARTAEAAKRELDLDRRFDAAQAALPDAKLRSVSIQEFPDSFVVRYSGKAHGRFIDETTRQARREQSGQPADYTTPKRQYALAVVVDWNGRTAYDDLGSTELTADLSKYLSANPGLLIPITDAAATLAGIVSEEKKSRA